MKQLCISLLILTMFMSGCTPPEASPSSTISVQSPPPEPSITPIPRSYNIQEDFVEFKGYERKFYVMVPDEYSGEESYPLVIYLHTYGGTALREIDQVGMNSIANDNNFLIVYPAAWPNWNSGIGENNMFPVSDNDDVGYISDLIDILSESYNIDLSRIYATGWSNGGFMSYKLACQLSDRIAAVAAVAGVLSEITMEECIPSHPIPVLHIHGTEDGSLPYEGFDGFHSVDETIEYWAGANQCQESETSAIPDTDVNDYSTVEKVMYSDCLEGSSVVLYKVIGGGHTWPDMPIDLNYGKINRDINAGEVIWEFFQQYSLSIQPSIQSDVDTYSSETFSFNYPSGYTITQPTQSFPALTIEKARNKRMEIFQMDDFGDRPWGFTGEESQEDIDGYVPKEKLTVGSGENQYDVWLFYSENDSQTKEELESIFNSIVIYQ